MPRTPRPVHVCGHTVHSLSGRSACPFLLLPLPHSIPHHVFHCSPCQPSRRPPFRDPPTNATHACSRLFPMLRGVFARPFAASCHPPCVDTCTPRLRRPGPSEVFLVRRLAPGRASLRPTFAVATPQTFFHSPCLGNRILQPARRAGAFHCCRSRSIIATWPCLPLLTLLAGPRPPGWGRAPWGEPLPPPPRLASSLLSSALQPPGIVVRCTSACCASSNRCAPTNDRRPCMGTSSLPSAVPFAALIPHFSFLCHLALLACNTQRATRHMG